MSARVALRTCFDDFIHKCGSYPVIPKNLVQIVQACKECPPGVQCYGVVRQLAQHVHVFTNMEKTAFVWHCDQHQICISRMVCIVCVRACVRACVCACMIINCLK